MSSSHPPLPRDDIDKDALGEMFRQVARMQQIVEEMSRTLDRRLGKASSHESVPVPDDSIDHLIKEPVAFISDFLDETIPESESLDFVSDSTDVSEVSMEPTPSLGVMQVFVEIVKLTSDINEEPKERNQFEGHTDGMTMIAPSKPLTELQITSLSLTTKLIPMIKNKKLPSSLDQLPSRDVSISRRLVCLAQPPPKPPDPSFFTMTSRLSQPSASSFSHLLTGMPPSNHQMLPPPKPPDGSLQMVTVELQVPPELHCCVVSTIRFPLTPLYSFSHIHCCYGVVLLMFDEIPDWIVLLLCDEMPNWIVLSSNYQFSLIISSYGQHNVGFLIALLCVCIVLLNHILHCANFIFGLLCCKVHAINCYFLTQSVVTSLDFGLVTPLILQLGLTYGTLTSEVRLRQVGITLAIENSTFSTLERSEILGFSFQLPNDGWQSNSMNFSTNECEHTTQLHDQICYSIPLVQAVCLATIHDALNLAKMASKSKLHLYLSSAEGKRLVLRKTKIIKHIRAIDDILTPFKYSFVDSMQARTLLAHLPVLICICPLFCLPSTSVIKIVFCLLSAGSNSLLQSNYVYILLNKASTHKQYYAYIVAARSPLGRLHFHDVGFGFLMSDGIVIKGKVDVFVLLVRMVHDDWSPPDHALTNMEFLIVSLRLVSIEFHFRCFKEPLNIGSVMAHIWRVNSYIMTHFCDQPTIMGKVVFTTMCFIQNCRKDKIFKTNPFGPVWKAGSSIAMMVFCEHKGMLLIIATNCKCQVEECKHPWLYQHWDRAKHLEQSFQFKQWDPGKFYNLEDKVDFDGVGNDMILEVK